MTQTTDTSLDTLLQTLCHSYRRRILRAVADQAPRKEEELISEAFDFDVLDEAEAERMRIELYHTHLPKLAEGGYVDWSPESETIRRGPNFEEAASLVERIDRHEKESPADWQ